MTYPKPHRQDCVIELNQRFWNEAVVSVSKHWTFTQSQKWRGGVALKFSDCCIIFNFFYMVVESNILDALLFDRNESLTDKPTYHPSKPADKIELMEVFGSGMMRKMAFYIPLWVTLRKCLNFMMGYVPLCKIIQCRACLETAQNAHATVIAQC